MILKDFSFDSPRENVFFDDVLLSMAHKQGAGEYLRFWESPVYFIVLGKIGKVDEEVDMPQALERGMDVFCRTSGGGTVLQGPGCLNYAFILSKSLNSSLHDLTQSYTWISQKLIKVLKSQGIAAKFEPISDLALEFNSKKFSGNAQRRTSSHILHHGTILYDFDLSLISQCLKIPKAQPVYRFGRNHQDFVTNVPLKPQVFKKALIQEFQCDPASQAITAQEQELLSNYFK